MNLVCHILLKKLLKILRESIKENNVDHFDRHLDELERVVQNTGRMKELLGQDGTLCYSAYIGSNPMVEILIQRGAGKEYVYTLVGDIKLVQRSNGKIFVNDICSPLPPTTTSY